MMVRLEPGQHAGSREHARELVAALPAQLTGITVALDCAELVAGTPSFLDEIVKEILVTRRADRLEIVGSSRRIATLADRAAVNREVADRLITMPRAA